MPGPPPLPTKLKLLRGNPGKRKMNKREPRLGAKPPTCPTWLPSEAKVEWRRIVKVLDAIGLLTLADRASLTSYCLAWNELRVATQLLTREGHVRQVLSGSPDSPTVTYQPHPAIRMQRTAWAAVKSFSALFGLDPSTRSKIEVPKDEAAASKLQQFRDRQKKHA